MKIVGIDPGIDTAACAVISVDPVICTISLDGVERFPSRLRARRGVTSLLPDVVDINERLIRFVDGAELVVIEQTQGIPGRSAMAMHQLGVAFGLYAGLVCRLDVGAVCSVRPQVWQSRVGLRGYPKEHGFVVLDHLCRTGSRWFKWRGPSMSSLDEHCVDAIWVGLFGIFLVSDDRFPHLRGVHWLRPALPAIV